MGDKEKDKSTNEVEISLEKYMALIDKLDEQEDNIKEMQEEAKKARAGLEPPKRKVMDLFLDDNDINEKSIIGFISFFLMTKLLHERGCPSLTQSHRCIFFGLNF